MPVNPDFRDLLSALCAEGVEYLLVGAHAVAIYAEPRYTKDMDLWVRPSVENAHRVFRALQSFGAPLEGIAVEDFADAEIIYQLGVAPNRVDIMMRIEGVGFEAAWTNRVERTYGDVPLHVISKEDLIRAKKASGRPQDLLDLEKLQ